jgi:hypothetical protein
MLPQLWLNKELLSCEPILSQFHANSQNAESQIASHLGTTSLLEEKEI